MCVCVIVVVSEFMFVVFVNTDLLILFVCSCL